MSGTNDTPLYSREVTGPFAALCGGGKPDDNMESCIAVADLEGGGFALRGTKREDQDHGGEIRVTPAEIRAFAEGALADPRFQV